MSPFAIGCLCLAAFFTLLNIGLFWLGCCAAAGKDTRRRPEAWWQ